MTLKKHYVIALYVTGIHFLSQGKIARTATEMERTTATAPVIVRASAFFFASQLITNVRTSRSLPVHATRDVLACPVLDDKLVQSVDDFLRAHHQWFDGFESVAHLTRVLAGRYVSVSREGRRRYVVHAEERK